MEQLVVRLGTNLHDPVHWVVWSTQSQDVIASGELASAEDLASLSERTSQRRAIVLVPGADVRLSTVTLPGKVNRKLQNAIPFMLEDELAEDISELFFAMGPAQGNQQSIAVVSHRQMEKWQHWLSQAELTAEAIIPDTLALPAPQQEEWIAIALGDQLIVRQGAWQGMQGEQAFLTSVLAFQAKTLAEPVAVTALTDVDLHAVPNINQTTANEDVPAIGVLAKYAGKASFSLLQGQYKAKKQHNQLWQVWRAPLILLAVVVLITLADRTLELNQLKQQNATLSAQIDTLVKQGFPDIGTYRNVRLKIQQEMQRLEQSGDGSSLLVMLEQLNPAFASSRITPQTLRFDANRTEIRMQAQGKDFNALDTFKRTAEAAGFTVEQGAINNRDNMVIGTMNIRGAS
ncbi:type II secretion system protein GspL [Alteromonas lipolytica]|uniref:Type II secretion system protein L n=1 Tax=Alteromonas lipolytica TaxID=1856405 RepID=A0A1E8FB07_9ALTE|nr:type II secretion system protein GspL [Alteromonas lipolytica]OFI33095.1 type II secretion system protein GspL [Alteromonas lipolytica]GGF62540.1 type II secretion system protein L [Alteromonas lipolytica]